MCDSHDHGLTRRGLAGLALAGAASLALPPQARAAEVVLDALCLMCIDYRLPSASVGAFDMAPVPRVWPGPGKKKYDLVALAGASLAAASERSFLPTVAGFWQQLGAAYTLHKVRKLIVMDHLGCGAFNVEFNGGRKPPLPYKQEYDLHLKVMKHLKQVLPERAAGAGAPSGLPVEFWIFMDPDAVSPKPTKIDL